MAGNLYSAKTPSFRTEREGIMLDKQTIFEIHHLADQGVSIKKISEMLVKDRKAVDVSGIFLSESALPVNLKRPLLALQAYPFSFELHKETMSNYQTHTPSITSPHLPHFPSDTRFSTILKPILLMSSAPQAGQ